PPLVIRLLLPLVFFLVACSGTKKEQEQAIPDEWKIPDELRDDRASFWDDFIDDEDGAFDASDFLLKPHGFLPLAIPITEPAIGFGLVGGLIFFHDKGPPKKGVPPTVTAVIGGATTNDTWLAGLGHQHIWKDGDIRYLGAAGYADVNLDFFGLGADPGDDRSTDLNFEGAFLLQEIRHRVGRSDFFAGLDYMFMNIDTTFQVPILPIPPIRVATRSSGLGAFAAYDTRDNHFTPNKGIDALLGARIYDEAIGSDNDYYKVRGQFRTWIPMGERVVLGLRLDAEAASDDTPLFDLPFVKLRGVPAFKYVDDFAMSAEIEPRFQITDRWGAVVFAGAGQTAGDFSDVSGADPVWAAGAGFRYLLARKMGVQAGIDVAYSDDDVAFYITVGSAWLR
ncbi:MAG: BamA/TamA family outer membrane protein, partial [Planctomycetota bacterium]